jgi:hypothetical protein
MPLTLHLKLPNLRIGNLFRKLWNSRGYFYWPLIVLPQFLGLLGDLTNQIAKISNGGAMPAYSFNCVASADETGATDATGFLIHTCMTHKTHFKLFCDWLIYPDWIWSPGDLLIMLREYTATPLFWIWFGLILMAAHKSFKEKVQ